MTGLPDTVLLRTALAEDIGSGDVTSDAIIPADARSSAEIRAKQDLVLAGTGAARAVFHLLDPETRFEPAAPDGAKVGTGGLIATVRGKTRVLLAGERVALNLLQHLSGIATLTALYVDAVRGTAARILDTRKTLPGLRQLEKEAVRVGGGMNHRMGLYDMILIKDNHIAAAGSVSRAIERARSGAASTLPVEVEAGSLAEAREALAAGADIIMLDNMPPALMKEAVSLIRGKALVEASGNVSLDNVREIARTGVDRISIGALTHSAPAADISMKIARTRSETDHAR